MNTETYLERLAAHYFKRPLARDLVEEARTALRGLEEASER